MANFVQFPFLLLYSVINQVKRELRTSNAANKNVGSVIIFISSVTILLPYLVT
jgi:hypothetical protein